MLFQYLQHLGERFWIFFLQHIVGERSRNHVAAVVPGPGRRNEE
jgi:hypothetical protein